MRHTCSHLRSRVPCAVAVVALIVMAAVPWAVAADLPLSVTKVETAEYPKVSLTVALPPTMAEAKDVHFEVRENGTGIDSVVAEPVTAEAAPARVVLLIDVSGSMAGAPLKAAQDAATRFVKALDPTASVALVVFSDAPRTLSGFTTDRAALTRAIAQLSASGETALYDGLSVAAGLVPADPSVRTSIVALSDGGDTVSNTSFETVTERLKKSGAPVYGVALKSDEYNPRALELLASGSGGRLVPVARADALAAQFEGIARELNSAWTVSYVSVEPRTTDVELDVVATAGDEVASARTAYPNPAIETLGADKGLVVPQVSDDPRMLVGVAALGFVSVAMLVAGVMLLAVREPTGLSQLRYYDQLRVESQAEGGAADQVRSAVVDAVGSVAGKRGFTKLATDKLEAAGMPLRAEEYITGHLLLVIGSGVLTQLLSGRFALSVMVVIIVTVVPLIVVDIAADRRRSRFETQIPDVLSMIAGSLRGGWGVQQSIALAGKEAPEPAAGELRRVDTEARLGMPLERSLRAMADRMNSADFHAAVNAISIQRDVGGNLAEVLDIVAHTIRERDAVRRQIKSLTAEGRLSAYILIGLPIVIFMLLMIVNPVYLEPLLTTPTGLLMLLFGAGLLVVGSIWLFRLTRIEV